MRKKSYYICLLFFLFLSYSFAAPQGGRDMLEHQPYFTLHIEAYGCPYHISFNDVPVMDDDIGIPVTVDYPINEWIKSGDNSITVRLTPNKDANKLSENPENHCAATVALQVREFGEAGNKNEVISKIVYQTAPNHIIENKELYESSSKPGRFDSKNKFVEDQNGDVTVSKIETQDIKGAYGYGIELDRTINFKASFPKWAWLSSDKIDNNQRTKEELLQEYKKIWNALNSQNIVTLYPLFKERIDEYSKAYFVDKNSVDVLKDLEESISNSEMKLSELAPMKYVYLKTFGNNHLAKLTIWDGSALLFFNYKDGSTHVDYDIIYRKSGNKWIITR